MIDKEIILLSWDFDKKSFLGIFLKLQILALLRQGCPYARHYLILGSQNLSKISINGKISIEGKFSIDGRRLQMQWKWNEKRTSFANFSKKN